MAGINHGGQRPKSAKHLRSATTKHFKNDDAEAKGRYAQKMAARVARKLKKNRRK